MPHDTIAAISTPIGEGGISIVRLSGDDAVEIAERVFRGTSLRSLGEAPSHTIHYGHVCAGIGLEADTGEGDTRIDDVEGDTRIDEVLLSVMRAPRTYTREDVVEINCHGGAVAAREVLDAVLRAGARLAERGEFTQRAFTNGRISLDQAKAVLDVVQAKTGLGLEAAVDRLGGRFARQIEELREALADLLADLDVEIDYPDLDVDVATIRPRVEALHAKTAELLGKSEQGRLIREGMTVAIVGRPNVGKSTLLNALLSEPRAIVTPIPGTTRDTVEEEASLAGIPVRWIDTAGLREPGDPVESEGVKRTLHAVDRADLVLLVLDRSEGLTREDRDLLERDWEVPVVLIENKIDLESAALGLPAGAWAARIGISAERGDGLTAFTDRLIELLTHGELPTRNSVLLLDSWERDLLRRMAEGLERAGHAMGSGYASDIVAEELRAAYRAAGELQGIDVSESILDAVFSRFCVGK